MTDAELIESLRLWNRDDAADRIEALIEESGRRLALARSEGAARVDQFERAEALEAKLAKAVEALEFLEIAATGSGVPHPKERELLHDCIRKARATLAEIKLQSSEFATQKGESHE